MTRAAQGLVGVSFGTEPNEDQMNVPYVVRLQTGEIGHHVEGRHSFGSLRSSLIAEAFNKCGGLQAVFRRQIIALFSKYALNVRMPHL